MTNSQDLAMSFALRPQTFVQFHTFNTHVWSWSIDGENFTDALSYEIIEFGGSNFWSIHELDFSDVAALNGAENVILRLTLSGALTDNIWTSFDNIQIHANPSSDPECLPADLNCDGIVDGADLGLLLGAWGPCNAKAPCDADLNEDGVVDGADLGLLLGAWGGSPGR